MANSNNSMIRQNFEADSEAGINKQINIQLYTSYVYLSMSYYFDREDVALPNIAKFFKEQSEEEREQANKLMKYQNTRGGRVILQNVEKPEKNVWGSALEAFQAALALQKFNNQTLLELHKVADANNDPQMHDFIEEDYLRKQVELIEKLGKAITNLKRVGTGLGEFMFDKEYFC